RGLIAVLGVASRLGERGVVAHVFDLRRVAAVGKRCPVVGDGDGRVPVGGGDLGEQPVVQLVQQSLGVVAVPRAGGVRQVFLHARGCVAALGVALGPVEQTVVVPNANLVRTATIGIELQV